MSITSNPINEASKLSNINFPEFTSKLITDTFEALISANLNQTEAYTELVKQISEGLNTFINNTKDDISGEDILKFIIEKLPSGYNTLINKKNEEALTDEMIKDINNVVEIEELENKNSIKADKGPKISDNFDDIIEAISKRIAANKYDLLKEMVKMGILRLVVEEGEIESRLTFSSEASSYSQSYSHKYNRKISNVGGRGHLGLFSRALKISGGANRKNLTVSTATKFDRDKAGSHVQIFGGIKIKFKTDYQSLEN